MSDRISQASQEGQTDVNPSHLEEENSTLRKQV